MHNALPLSLAVLVSVGIIVIGCSTLHLLSESWVPLVSSRQHPMPTLVRGYV